MRVKSIKLVEPRTVYAIKTSTGTYIADGLAHHNCVGCNIFKSGEQYEHGRQIDLLHGDGTAERLHQSRHITHKLTKDELEGIIRASQDYIKDLD